MSEEIATDDVTSPVLPSPGSKDKATTHDDGTAAEDAHALSSPDLERRGVAVVPEVGPLVAFNCFPKLPIELRLKIWKEVCFVPRVIDVFRIASEQEAEGLYGDVSDEEGFNEDAFFGILDSATTFETVTARTVPPILHTSHEARTEGRKHYSLEFGSDFTPAKIYINCKSDIICSTECFENLDYSGLGASMGSALPKLKEYQKLRRLAVKMTELKSLMKSLPSMDLDDIIVYLAPDIGSWTAAQSEDEMERRPFNNVNSNTRFGITFMGASEYLKAHPKKSRKEEDLYDSFIPRVSKARLERASEKVLAVTAGLTDKGKRPGWKPPRFEVMVLEIHQKENYWAHESERYRTMKAIAEKKKERLSRKDE